MNQDNDKSKEKAPSLNNMDTGALQARIEKAQTDIPEEAEALSRQEALDSSEIHRTIRRVAGRQLWIIAVCVLMVLAAAAVLALQFGDLFSGRGNTDETVSLTAGDAPWLSFANGMLSYNAEYTGDFPAELVIPDTFDGNTVEGVADEGFTHMEEVVSVAVGENVSYIGVRAFEGCGSLTQLDLGGVQEISYGAFDGCTSLTSVAGGNISSIGAYAFQDCASLSSFPLGESVTTIGTCAFQNCSALGPDLLLSSSVSRIGQSAYEGCTSLLRVEIPDADSIGEGAFAGCTALTSVQMDCLNVGNRALAGCTALENAAFGGKTLTLGAELFDGCTALTAVTYENEGTTLSESAFQGCTSLTVAPLPAGTTEIPARMFAGCINCLLYTSRCV